MTAFWGKMIEDTINYGREDHSSKLKKITKLELCDKEFEQCSHVMIYSKTASEFMGFPKKAYILMQMRFDGGISFPGGTVGRNETPVQALCREMKEMGWTDSGPVSESHYQFSYSDEENEVISHFYAVEVPEEKLKEIEMKLPKMSDYGNSILGFFRVPLYRMGDAFRGFPAFLKNHFVGNAKLELIETIAKLGLMPEEQIIQSLNSAPRITF